MNFEVIVELKKEVLDAEGRAITQSLTRLGHETLKSVRVSKRFVIEVHASEDEALRQAEAIAKEFLANPVSETFKLKRLNQHDQTDGSR